MVSVNLRAARILLFTCEPGGAAMLGPLNRLLLSNGLEAELTGYGHAGVRFRQEHIEYREVAPIEIGDFGLINETAPDVIITSATSLPEFDMSEKNLWLNAREMKIPSVAFIDQWQNYSARFSGRTEGEMSRFQPDFINCINEIGCREAVEHGLPRERLRAFGHPYLSELQIRYGAVSEANVRIKLGLDANKPVALFVSEAIREHFGASRGYDQYGALEIFLRHLKKKGGSVTPIIKLHPKDNIERFRDIIGVFGSMSPIVIHNELTSLECLKISNSVFGMTSMMLVEAYLLGKSVVSIQPGLKGEDPLVLSRHGLVPLVVEVQDLERLPNESGRGSDNGTPADFNVGFKSEEFIHFVCELADNKHYGVQSL